MLASLVRPGQWVVTFLAGAQGSAPCVRARVSAGASRRAVPLSETRGPTPRLVAATSDGTGTEAAARVADVLLMFIRGPGSLGVSAIGRELGLSKAVVHRILKSLVSREVLVLDPVTRGYSLGPSAAALGARALRDSDLRTAAMPVLCRLRDVTGETTTLSELVRDERVYLDQYESAQEIKMTVETGRGYPLHAGASGKAILAFLPRARRDALLQKPLAALTPRTVVDAEQLSRELALVRREYAAFSSGERQYGAGAVAAPVFAVDGAVVGAVSVCGPLDRFDAAAFTRYLPLARDAGAEVSRALGWPDYEHTAATDGRRGRTASSRREAQA